MYPGKVTLVTSKGESFPPPAEVRDVLAAAAGQHPLEQHETPKAFEWHTSQQERKAP